jgi:hypothetical protein
MRGDRAARAQPGDLGWTSFDVQRELCREHDFCAGGGLGERQVMIRDGHGAGCELRECAAKTRCEQRDARAGHLFAGA